jgi:hypothetical protein
MNCGQINPSRIGNMKTNLFHFRPMAAAIAAAMVLASTVSAATAAVTTQLEPGEVALGQSAQLTITTSGDGNDPVSPPSVPGLEFVSVGQSSQMESINGVTSSTTAETYEVIPQHAGKFTIPALSRGAKVLVLYVRPSGAAAGNNSGASSLPPPTTSGLSAGPTSLTKDGTAFVRLRLPKRELYVGEIVPVDIQVGVRAGLAASISGLPTLNGDAFMLNKLSSKPEQAQENIDGQPYSVLTWHSALAVVKPGDFSLNVETPLTVKMRVAPQRRPRLPQGMFGDSMMDDAFSDSFFQDFFGGTTEKEITVASEAETLKVLPLPTEGRPAGFDGAVGKFEVASELSAAQGAAGDPLTLRLKVTGAGSFDRVNSAVLGQVDGWKTYKPTAKFEPADNAGYSGEKDFEQAVIPMQPGRQIVPALTFSFFDPDTRRYETKLTAPLSVEVSPAPAESLDAATAPASIASPAPANEPPRDGLRPDHVVRDSTVASLRPLYFQAWFVGSQGALVLCFAGGVFFLHRKERRASDSDATQRHEASTAITSCLAEMDAASTAGDAARFFQSARVALQQKLAASWHTAPASITIAEIDARLNGQGGEIRRVFSLADQAAYSGQHLSTADFQQWKEIVREQIQHTEAL